MTVVTVVLEPKYGVVGAHPDAVEEVMHLLGQKFLVVAPSRI